MTALAAYVRLECEGRFRPRPDAAPVSVLVKFGDASLMIMSFREEPITHWPLASLARLAGPVGGRLTLAPDAEAPERLEIDDTDMVAAIGAVCERRATGPLPPRRRRRSWRWLAGVVIVTLLTGASVAVSPRLLDVLADNLPENARAQLGTASLSAYVGAARCSTPAGERALALLARQLAGPDGGVPGLMVAALPPGAPDALSGAGRQVLISHRLILAATGPGDLAAPVARALAEAAAAGRTASALRSAGLGALAEVLTGNLAGPRLTAAALAGLRAAPARGGAVADGVPPPAEAMVALRPADWLALRQICAR